MNPVIQALIERYRLEPLPVEGTLFVQSYRTALELQPGRPAGTAMIGLYCEEPLSHSLFHRLTLDEVWHFYSGDPFRLILLRPDGSTEDVILGPDPTRGHHCQVVVPAGVWQPPTSSPEAPTPCTAAPFPRATPPTSSKAAHGRPFWRPIRRDRATSSGLRVRITRHGCPCNRPSTGSVSSDRAH